MDISLFEIRPNNHGCSGVTTTLRQVPGGWQVVGHHVCPNCDSGRHVHNDLHDTLPLGTFIAHLPAGAGEWVDYPEAHDCTVSTSGRTAVTPWDLPRYT